MKMKGYTTGWTDPVGAFGHSTGTTVPGQVIYTTDSTLGQAYNAVQAPATPLLESINKNTDVLRELRDDLLPLKKWLMLTYPDIYKQYVAVQELQEVSK